MSCCHGGVFLRGNMRHINASIFVQAEEICCLLPALANPKISQPYDISIIRKSYSILATCLIAFMNFEFNPIRCAIADLHAFACHIYSLVRHEKYLMTHTCSFLILHHPNTKWNKVGGGGISSICFALPIHHTHGCTNCIYNY